MYVLVHSTYIQPLTTCAGGHQRVTAERWVIFFFITFKVLPTYMYILVFFFFWGGGLFSLEVFCTVDPSPVDNLAQLMYTITPRRCAALEPDSSARAKKKKEKRKSIQKNKGKKKIPVRSQFYLHYPHVPYGTRWAVAAVPAAGGSGWPTLPVPAPPLSLPPPSVRPPAGRDTVNRQGTTANGQQANDVMTSGDEIFACTP